MMKSQLAVLPNMTKIEIRDLPACAKLKIIGKDRKRIIENKETDISRHADKIQNWIMKAELYVTTKCKGGCPFCFGQGDFGVRGRHVPIELLIHRSDILLAFHRKHPFYSIPLLGGEPLLHPELPELAKTYGKHLPFALVSAGEPDDSVEVEHLIDRIKLWGVTYNPHLAHRYLKLINKLFEANQEVETSMHFHDFKSFSYVNMHFIEYILPRLLKISAEWKAEFIRYVKSWHPDSYYNASFDPFCYENGRNAPMIVRYSMIDERFMRNTPKIFEPPLYPRRRSFPCHLFRENKAIAIAEDGKVFPCTSTAQRHAYPVIKNIDRFGCIPEDLPDYLDKCAERLLEVKYREDCDVRCKRIKWNLDT